MDCSDPITSIRRLRPRRGTLAILILVVAGDTFRGLVLTCLWAITGIGIPIMAFSGLFLITAPRAYFSMPWITVGSGPRTICIHLSIALNLQPGCITSKIPLTLAPSTTMKPSSGSITDHRYPERGSHFQPAPPADGISYANGEPLDWFENPQCAHERQDRAVATAKRDQTGASVK